MIIGIISDTHGRLRPEAVAALKGVAHILHAGDIGRPEVIAELQAIAPTTAIRGNVDRGPWAEAYPEVARLTLGGRRLLMLHRRKDLQAHPAAGGVEVVVSGHSHKPAVERIGGVLFVNPGSAGPRRFRLPVTLARLDLAADPPTATLCHLDVSP